MVTLHEEGISFAFRININKTKIQVENYIINTLWPIFKTDIDTKLSNNFTNYSLGKGLQVIELGNNDYEIAVIFILSGDTILTKARLQKGADNQLNALKTLVKTHIALLGGTILPKGFHMHKTTGSVNED